MKSKIKHINTYPLIVCRLVSLILTLSLLSTLCSMVLSIMVTQESLVVWARTTPPTHVLNNKLMFTFEPKSQERQHHLSLPKYPHRHMKRTNHESIVIHLASQSAVPIPKLTHMFQ